jgi:putative ABC transport system substrate-binding protein
MNRRRLLAALGSVLVARAVSAQERVRMVGYLSNGADAKWLADALSARGYVPGRNLRIDLRIAADGRSARTLAAELVAARPEVLVAFRATLVDALVAETTAIPIVCGGTADPVGVGYAKTLQRPGRNITGISYGIPEVAEILVGLMRKLLPRVRSIVAIVERADRGDGGWRRVWAAFEAKARAAGVAWEVASFPSFEDMERLLARLDPAFDLPYFVQYPEGIDLARVGQVTRRRRFVTFAASPEMVRAGLLAHYSIDHADARGRVAGLVDAILRGANPAEMPWELPDRTSFVVNRATAKAVGLELPADILARATEILD